MRSFRLVCEEVHKELVEALLKSEGYVFANEAFSPWCRMLLEEPKPLGSSLAAYFGKIYIQDRSSMLPPLALMDEYSCGASVLDMCASPGSKTGFLAQLTGHHGFVLGNEPAKPRLGTLRANMQHLGMMHVSTCSYGGELLPLLAQSLDKIQLDPPCSGWGTVEKNPQVLKLWQGDKVKPLVALQQRLLQKAYELLRPGGTVVYSTCTTNEAENEAQVRYAVEELGFELVPLQPFAGFVWEDPLFFGQGTLRVDGERSQAQGFYIAKLRKPETCHESEAFVCTDTHFVVPNSLDTSALEAPCTDLSRMPEGHVVTYGDVARFVPQRAPHVLPASLQWQAAPLGKVMGGQVRLLPRCTALMPLVAPSDALVLEDIAQIRALIQGQQVLTSLKVRETGVYFGHALGTLPLGRITIKNGRALWGGK